MLCDGLEGMEGVQGGSRGRDMCIHRADSFYCIAETLHNVVKQLYSNKNVKKSFGYWVVH